MPDKRKHRGQHPQDKKLFNERFFSALQSAVSDLSWLLTNGYSEKASLKLVGDRYRLTARQRLAVLRASCTDGDLQIRNSNQLTAEEISNSHLVLIDGYNLLITIESALSGGLIFTGRDGCYRDLASVHGTYRKVEETRPAVELIGNCLQELGIISAEWYFDSPVSNSGRLKNYILEIAHSNNWNWKIELVTNPDKLLIKAKEVIITSDGEILNQAEQWFHLSKYIIEKHIPEAKNVKMG